MSDLFHLALSWEDLDTEAREPLRKMVTELVGYPCKLACKPNNSVVTLVVYSISQKRITDWLELQSSGAVGVLFSLYKDDADDDVLEALNERCENYNASLEVAFKSDSDSELESSDEGSNSE